MARRCGRVYRVDLTDTGTAITIGAGALMAVGVIGIIVPILPGLLLCWLGVLLWAVFGEGGGGRWVVLAIATAVALTGVVIKYAWPGRNLKRTGVPTRTVVAGGLLGLIGFFVIPVVGLIVGFILGVFLAERARLGETNLAWPSTKSALKAVGLSMLIELGAALTMVAVWIVGLVTV